MLATTTTTTGGLLCSMGRTRADESRPLEAELSRFFHFRPQQRGKARRTSGEDKQKQANEEEDDEKSWETDTSAGWATGRADG